MKSANLFNQIHELVDHQVRITAQRNKLNLNDRAVFSENIFGRIFNVLTDSLFINANDGVSNVDSIDLWDQAKLAVLQVTTREKGFKKKKEDTINGFLVNPAFDAFTSLHILFAGPKEVTVAHRQRVEIRPGCFYEGIDINRLLSKIRNAEPEQMEKILAILQKERQDIEQREVIAQIDKPALKRKLQFNLEQFVQLKYFSNTHKSHAPLFNNRRVKRHSREILFDEKELNITQERQVKKMEVVVGDFSSLIDSDRPTFLFGELGSGKSTIISRYLYEQNQDGNSLNLLIAANYIKSKIGESPDSVLQLISRFLKDQLILTTDIDLRLLLAEHPVTVAFDGIDELSSVEASLLLKHLRTIYTAYGPLTIIASGRPIELKPLIKLSDWNCLSVIDLSLQEIRELLINEALASGLDKNAAVLDTQQRLAFLKLRTDLLSLAVTPLVVTLIRDHLKADSVDLSLGDLLYKVLKERLGWDAIDQPLGTNKFFGAYPHILQREKFIALVAKGMAESPDNSIQEELLFRLTDRFVDSEISDRSKVVNDGLAFLKKAFLQQMDDRFSFVSQPLFDTCLAIHIADNYSSIQTDEIYIQKHWRAIGGAAAVIRARAEVNGARDWFKNIVDVYLSENDRTTISAIITQELNDPELAIHYVARLKELGYRPLRIWDSGNNNWDDPDTFSPVAIAYTLAIAGVNGFDWWFDEYLSLRRYVHMNETSLNANILLHYLVKRRFHIEASSLAKLASLIPYHLRFGTFSCSNFVPTAALILPESLELRERCLALVIMLTKSPAYDKAFLLINDLCKNNNKQSVIEAIETLASEGQYQKAEVISLWYELNNSSDISIPVLKGTIKVLLGGEESLKDIVFRRVGKDNFIRLLKYLALENGEDADEAALLLFELTGETGFYLVGRPIMFASKWHHGNDLQRRQIMQEVIRVNPKNVNDTIARNLIVRKSEIPLLGFTYFIKALLDLDDDHSGRFTYAVNYLPKYILTRNPELRDDLQKLLTTKPEYFNVLLNATQHLDTVLRENAIKIIIACLPENCASELETYISGLVQPFAHDEDEWLSFLYKLNFSGTVLDHLYSKSKDFVIVGKTLALTLLYHRGCILKEDEISEMVRGLLGKGRFIDRTENGLQSKRVIEDERLFPYILKLLYVDSSDDYDNTSSILQSYFMDKLSQEDFLYVLALQLERHHLYLFEFDEKHLDHLSEPATSEVFRKACLKVQELLNLDEAFGEIYINAIAGDKQAWVRLFEKMMFERDHYQEYILYHFERWAINKRRTHPDLIATAGQAVVELLDYPAIKDYSRRDSVAVHLAIVADEFAALPKEKLNEILTHSNGKEDLLAVAAYRLGYIPEYLRSRRETAYMPLFKEYRPAILPKIDVSTAREWLFKTDEIPKDFDLFLKAVILHNVYHNELQQLQGTSGLGRFLLAVFKFLDDGAANFDDLLESTDAIYQLRGDKYFGEMIRLLKEISLSKPRGKEAYVASLEKKIVINRKIFLAETAAFFQELIALEVPFSLDMLTALLNGLMDRSYLLDQYLLNDLAYYTCKILPEEQRGDLATYLRVNIRAITNSIGQIHRDEHLQVCWLFSLMYLYIEQKNDDVADLGFLFGLKSLFIQNSRRAYQTNDQDRWIQFKGRELLLHSDIILTEIPQSVIDKILHKGLTVKMPEINALCRFFRAFNFRGKPTF